MSRMQATIPGAPPIDIRVSPSAKNEMHFNASHFGVDHSASL